MEETIESKKSIARWVSFVFSLIQVGMLMWLYQTKFLPPDDITLDVAVSAGIQYPLAGFFSFLFLVVGIWTASYGQGKPFFIAHILLAALILLVVIM